VPGHPVDRRNPVDVTEEHSDELRNLLIASVRDADGNVIGLIQP